MACEAMFRGSDCDRLCDADGFVRDAARDQPVAAPAEEGSMSGVTKTRRGLEKTLFNITVGLSVSFFVIAIINVLLNR